MRWMGYVASMGEMRNTKYWSENPKGSNHLEDLQIVEKISERISEM
jgi:hypothetical protein